MYHPNHTQLEWMLNSHLSLQSESKSKGREGVEEESLFGQSLLLSPLTLADGRGKKESIMEKKESKTQPVE